MVVVVVERDGRHRRQLPHLVVFGRRLQPGHQRVQLGRQLRRDALRLERAGGGLARDLGLDLGRHARDLRAELGREAAVRGIDGLVQRQHGGVVAELAADQREQLQQGGGIEQRAGNALAQPAPLRYRGVERPAAKLFADQLEHRRRGGLGLVVLDGDLPEEQHDVAVARAAARLGAQHLEGGLEIALGPRALHLLDVEAAAGGPRREGLGARAEAGLPGPSAPARRRSPRPPRRRRGSR